MMILQAMPLGLGEEVIKKVEKGNIDQLVQQGISLGVEAGKSILLAAAIFFIGKYFIKLIKHLVVQMLERRNVEPTIQSFLKSFINILLTILLLITVVSALGVNTTSFAALLASAGLAVGMALSGNLQNLAGGILLLLFKPYKVGDYIEAQGINGTVKEIQIFHTVVMTPDNKQIYVPNGALSSGNVINYSSQDLRRVEWNVCVEYGSDAETVKAALQRILASDKRIMQDQPILIALGELAASSVNFKVRAWVANGDFWDVYFLINQKIYEDFNRQGIKFPFPQLQIHQS